MAEYDPIDELYRRIDEAALNWFHDDISTAEFREVVRDALIEARNFHQSGRKPHD